MESNNNNNKDNGLKMGVCDVHRLVNKDTTEREVYYCGLCKSWICLKCDPDLPKRDYAMLIKKFRGEQ